MDPKELSYGQSLVEAGLTKDEALVYETLVLRGPLQAGVLKRHVPISRPLVYKVLGTLEEAGLVEKRDEPGKVAVFAPAHPLKLQEIIEKKRESADRAKTALDGVLGKLVSDFNKISGQPGIRILEGKTGIRELYKDILEERQPLLLMRSYLDDTHPELAQLVEQQIRGQVRLDIHTRALTPPEQVPQETYAPSDRENKVERRVLPEDLFKIPAQVVVYANKVAITAYEGELITTIIEHSAIKKTFEVLFERLWQTSPEMDPYSGRDGATS